jgi:hypothetical protein
MRSHHFRCRTGAIAPVLTVAEYALIRPAAPVIPGRQDMKRPPYVPVSAHYVNPPGYGARRLRGIAVGAAVGILLVTAWLLFLGFVADPGARPAVPVPTATPSTYGPPPR